ncbi:hypothetical protein B0A55_10410 [Friedmanniomyces simplex]|uniref:Mediator of RNA polymerase II transcription subunit 13 n=1 Tax=Friedmanniomyces simplex TaxID=329884 RepID=A0A4V5NGR5_9PEZI|nr:hypothetical protein B0A55_10410 [Friedmanniomyces simplex]
MDFFKGCKTNVWQTEKVWQASFTKYSWRKDQAGCVEVRGLAAQLRRYGVLCTASELEAWVFGGVSLEAIDALQGYGLELVNEGTLAEDTLIKSALLDAIEGAVAFQLAGVPSVAKVGPYSWLVDVREDDGMGHVGGLHLRLQLRTTDSGTLYATISTKSSDLRRIGRDVTAGAPVILAPSGRRARFLGGESAGTRLVDSEDWKSMVAASLQAEIDDSPEWVPVQTLDGETQDCFFWPAHLCLENGEGSRLDGGESNWKTYILASEDDDGFTHPLTVAEDWFNGATERQAAAEGMIVDSMNDIATLPASIAGDGDGMVATSPPFVQRSADQQAAMSGIYPTPPDVLLQGQPASQPPTTDNPATGNPYNDPSSFGQDFLPTSDDIQPRQSTSSSSNPPAVQRGSDDLFGDLSGEMDFGAGEVGDEDFDFFNEEDAAAAAALGNDSDTIEIGHADADAAEMGGDHDSDVADFVAATPQAQEPPDESTTNVQKIEQALSRIDDQLVADSPLMPVELASDLTQATPQHEPDKPLSPFGIKERLLPPPIPASVNAAHQQLENPRRSNFDPLAFRADLEIGRKFSSIYGPGKHKTYSSGPPMTMDTSLPPTRKKPRVQRPPDRDSEASVYGSESEEDSYESASSVSDDDLPPKTPWSTKKRKRADYEELASSGDLQRMLGGEEIQDGGAVENDKAGLLTILERVLSTAKRNGPRWSPTQESVDISAAEPEHLGPVEEVLPLTKLDLVYTAQLVSEQATSCMPHIVEQLNLFNPCHDNNRASGNAVQIMVIQLIEHLLLNTTRLDITGLALIREPPSRAVSTPAAVRSGQPRPPQRPDGAILGPDIAAVPPPYVRVQRGSDTYEMLPPALDFWEPLSLAPTNGPKDVRAYCVYPLNEDLQRLTDNFLRDLGIRYENCKLGSHAYIRNVDENDHLDEYEDGLAPVELGEDDSIEGAMRAYAGACTKLGEFLATVGGHEPDRTIVVYLLNPFPRGHRVTQHLCACFWLFCKAYRERTPKALRKRPRSDVVLQILPMEMVASQDTLVMLDAKQLGALAKEVYDRCPPAPDGDYDATSALPNFSAPMVELASPPPKRIGFQLTAEPPSDLLHEGSSLHVAYALSSDGLWLTAAWADSTGRYQSCTSYCLRGRTFANVATEVWERTRELLAAREVTWRVFVIASGAVNDSYKNCWREVIGRPRKQPFSVTLLSAQLDLDLKLSPPTPATPDDTVIAGAPSGAGFLTPGSTPQATSMTVSPDTSGNAAPPTPAPNDFATALAESDPEAHLIDTADESWAVLFSSTMYPVITSTPAQLGALAYGALFKRGDASASSFNPPLPCLGVSLLWTVQVRPNGNVDAGNVKQTEMTLREVLRMYRSLSVLTRARGLAGGSGEG